LELEAEQSQPSNRPKEEYGESKEKGRGRNEEED
jgi:hypothetical protein